MRLFRQFPIPWQIPFSFDALLAGHKRSFGSCAQPARTLEAILSAVEILPFEAPADEVYGLLRSRLEKAGEPMGGNDLLIAAQTIALGYTIVTDNERKFARIAELPRENWLK